MKYRSIRLLLLVGLLGLQLTCPAPLIYTPGEGWRYEAVGSEGKWQRGRAKEQLDVAQAAFDQLGVDTMTISLGASYRWDLDQKQIALSNVALKIDELGALTLSTDLANMQPGPDLQKQGSLSHALLRYDDASLLDRGLKAFALMNNADPAAIRQQVAAMVDMRATALGDSPAIKAVADALKAFLAEPHSLTIELAPQAPVAFTALQGLATMQPADIATLIGLKVTANK